MATVSVTGLVDMHRRLIGITSGLKRGGARAILKAGHLIKKESLKIAPEDTGELKRSIRSRAIISEPRNKISVVITYQAIVPKNGFDYAAWQHVTPFPRRKSGIHNFLFGPAKKFFPKIKELVLHEARKSVRRKS